MYAGAFTFLGVAVMLLISTYIMGSIPMFGRAEVTIQAGPSVEYVKRLPEKIKAIEREVGTETCYYHGICGMELFNYDGIAIPIDDSIIAKFPRADEFRKAFKVLEERHLDPDECGGGPLRGSADICDTANMYEFEIGKSDADALKSIMKELALQHGKSKDGRSAVVWDYGLNREIVTQGMVITVKYNDIYYNIGVAIYSMP
ncbi:MULTISPECIES: hypothetical protein [Candidatus Nitrosocaldus]|nr:MULTISPECIES: hypothetical protein [Candidatus Nitrosocaldus]GBC74030.1 hypothetical protein HRbin05_00061 [archaeon HR05]